jgi:hypothetical protein
MIEVKIPQDIIKTPILKGIGISSKHTVYLIIAAVVIIPLALFGSRIMHQ